MEAVGVDFIDESETLTLADNPRSAIDPPDLGYNPVNRGLNKIDLTCSSAARENNMARVSDLLNGAATQCHGQLEQPEPRQHVTSTCFQIFIKPPVGKTSLVWVHVQSTIMQLKQKIWALMGYPVQIQHLVSGRRSLQDSRTLKNYDISPETTIALNLRLRGGALPQGHPSSSGGDKGKNIASQHQPKEGSSYKNILQGNRDPGSPLDQGGYTPRPYIVDQLGQTLALNFDSTGLKEFVKSYETQALICRFNNFWPKPMDLFHWIFTNWIMECDIHLCSKGFFIVKFTSTEVGDTIISVGPWFWGTSGLFMTP